MDLEDLRRRVGPYVIGHKRFNKIFCIGFNKTGTTTLEGVLRGYGYDLPDQEEQEARLTEACFRCDYTELRRFVERYDAFQDQPFSQGETYAVVDALFPNSRFILSERDPEEWFDSMTRFHKKVFKLDSLQGLSEEDLVTHSDYIYPGYSHASQKRMLTEFDGDQPVVRWDRLYDKDFYIAEYLARNRRIKRYFQNCLERLLVIDITREVDTRRLCEFLEIPKELVIDMPQFNRT
jgi:hypothetical protein